MTQTLEDKPAVHLPPAQKAIAQALIICATIVVVIDQTIANVALPHMQAALGATPDSISWVLTSYILATAIATPMTGWLSARVGRNRLFGISIVGFTISSALCGLSVSLPMMVISRLMQGFFGAFLMPLSQAFVYDMNAPSQQVRALMIWGMCVMVAPVIGPVLGGFLTETFDWRWVFFINVPIGVVASVGIFAVMPKFPSTRRSFDGVGFVIIMVALCGLQLALDRGTQQDWLDSTEIIVELGLSVAAFWMLFFHLRRHPNPIIPVELFASRNFVVAMMLTVVVVPIVVASSALLPPLVQVLLGHPVMSAGLLMAPIGVSTMICMLIAGKLMRQVDGRLLIGFGLLLTIWSLWLRTHFSVGMDDDLLIWSGLLQGAGAGFCMPTINFIAVSTLPAQFRTDGAAIYALVRSIGTSLMIALMTSLLARNIQINHAEVGSALHASSPPFLMSRIYGGDYAVERVTAMADAEVTRQAMMIAYIDDFWLMMWLAAAMLPVLLLLKPIRVGKGEVIEISE